MGEEEEALGLSARPSKCFKQPPWESRGRFRDTLIALSVLATTVTATVVCAGVRYSQDCTTMEVFRPSMSSETLCFFWIAKSVLKLIHGHGYI